MLDIINKKADFKDVDRLSSQVSELHKVEEERFLSVEEELQNLLQDFRSNLDTLRLQTLDSLSKKADFTFIDKVREQLSQKVDFEYF